MNKHTAPSPAFAAQIQKAAALHQQGRVREALDIYMNLLPSLPQNFDLYHMAGLAVFQLGDAAGGAKMILQALQINPNSAAAESNLGSALMALGMQDEAIKRFDRALELSPGFYPALLRKARVMQEKGQTDQALQLYEQARAQGQTDIAYLNNFGALLRDLSRGEEALEKFDAALKLNANDLSALINKAHVLCDLVRADDALSLYAKALNVSPNHPEAIKGQSRALDLKAQSFIDQEKDVEALELLDQAIVLVPDNVVALTRRAMLLEKMNRLDEALASFDQALKIDNELAPVHMNRGVVLQRLRHFGEAAKAFSRAIELDPSKAAGFINLGNVLQDQRQYEAALESYDRALATGDDDVNALYNRARALARLRRDDEALKDYDQAYKLDPSYPGLEAVRHHTRMMLCDWSDYESLETFLQNVRDGKAKTAPFVLIGASNDPSLQMDYVKKYARETFPPLTPLSQKGKMSNRGDGKIRIGYLSCDLHQHATAYLAAGLFEQHDRTKFETYAFSFGPNDKSDLRQRMERSFDEFIDISRLSEEQAAALIHAHDIDILVDLKGFTQDNRVGILARRPAPIQVNYLGYPGTMGVDYIDYIIADRHLISEQDEKFYTEKVICLPNSYQINDDKRFFPQQTLKRKDLGLPEEAFVFCSFNNTYKITPEIFDIWMRLLSRIEGSVFWLFDGGGSTSENLRREAEKRSVDPARLIFAPRLPFEEHLARQACANLFLDSFPCNAHTTASDALWMGLPLVTCRGNTFASRVASSLLHALGVSELVATDLVSYEEKAFDLATDREKLAAIRTQIQQARTTAPLFDTEKTTRAIEAAYQEMIKRL